MQTIHKSHLWFYLLLALVLFLFPLSLLIWHLSAESFTFIVLFFTLTSMTLESSSSFSFSMAGLGATQSHTFTAVTKQGPSPDSAYKPNPQDGLSDIPAPRSSTFHLREAISFLLAMPKSTGRKPGNRMYLWRDIMD